MFPVKTHGMTAQTLPEEEERERTHDIPSTKKKENQEKKVIRERGDEG